MGTLSMPPSLYESKLMIPAMTTSFTSVRAPKGPEWLASRKRASASRCSQKSNCANSSADRKPVDPPPIVQLRIRDDTDPSQNYLQSPYYFMCTNLYSASNNSPSLIPPHQALAGTLVSSLHRLKDIDNSDGGFFVFGDLSVKIEGEFRLKFSLFEMMK